MNINQITIEQLTAFAIETKPTLLAEFRRVSQDMLRSPTKKEQREFRSLILSNSDYPESEVFTEETTDSKRKAQAMATEGLRGYSGLIALANGEDKDLTGQPLDIELMRGAAALSDAMNHGYKYFR